MSDNDLPDVIPMDTVQADHMALTAHPIDFLRESILNLEHEQERLAALQAARERARHQSHIARSRLFDADAAMQAFAKETKSRLAYQYLNNENIDEDRSALKVEIDEARAQPEQLEAIDLAIDDEITRVAQEIRALVRIRDRRLCEYLIQSDEYQQLIALHRHAFTRLRTIKEALRAVIAGSGGQLPQQYVDEPSRSETLEIRVGYGVEEQFLEAWQEVMEELKTNADAMLPMFG